MRAIAPEIERVCLTIEDADEDNVQHHKPGPSPWTAGFDIDEVGGSVPRLVAAAGCAVWSPYFRNLTPEGLAESRTLGLKVIPWTVNERAEMERLIDLASTASSRITRTGCARPWLARQFPFRPQRNRLTLFRR